MTATKNLFKQQLANYSRQISDDITAYVKYLRESSHAQFGAGSDGVVEAFGELLTRPSKHLRGSLTIVAYQMSGGTNQAMIIQAARAMEMIHTSLLIIDDIQDRSPVRRGQPAAHALLSKQLKDEHLGESMAINAGLLGNYAANMILANLDVEPELRANVLSITSRTLLTTVHGQIADQLSPVQPTVPAAKIALWKTAQYSVLNPLHVGMVLAGADCTATDAITPYALELGQAFQIINDIDGVFGDNNGKDPLDDIKEGKLTILTEYALKHAAQADKKVLQYLLGKQDLTGSEFKRAQAIIKKTGALANAQKQAQTHVQQAIDSLEDSQEMWQSEGVKFLKDLALHLIK